MTACRLGRYVLAVDEDVALIGGVEEMSAQSVLLVKEPGHWASCERPVVLLRRGAAKAAVWSRQDGRLLRGKRATDALTSSLYSPDSASQPLHD